jgi:4'-phosphopantetheinyl transferase
MLAAYIVDIATAAAALEAIEVHTPRLSDAEEAHAASIPDSDRRRAWRASHIALRIVLERWAGEGIRRQQFRHGPNGRPSLPQPPPHFSLSHTEGLALVACASAGEVGVDVERRRDIALSPERQAMIKAAAVGLTPSDERLNGEDDILHAWTRLEALGKALGTGVGAVLAAARDDASGRKATGSDSSAVARLLRSADLRVVDLALPPPYCGALAAPRFEAFPTVVPLPTDEAGLRAFAAERDCVDLPDRPGQKGA